MSTNNKITAITRRNIADELNIGKLWYNGRLDEPDFLSRLYDLKNLLSRDYRYNNVNSGSIDPPFRSIDPLPLQ